MKFLIVGRRGVGKTGLVQDMLASCEFAPIDVCEAAPHEIDSICSSSPEEEFVLIHMDAKAEDAYKACMLDTDRWKSAAEWNTARKAEHLEFAAFEERLEKIMSEPIAPNCSILLEMQTQFDNAAYCRARLDRVLSVKREWDNLYYITKQLVAAGNIEAADENHVVVWMNENGEPKREICSYDRYVALILADREGYLTTVQAYLQQVVLDRQ